MRIPIGWSVSGLDNARISSRISASRSGGSGDMLIYPRDAADLKLCLPLPSFSLTKAGIRIIRERQTIPLQTSAIKNAALAQSHVHRLPSKRAPRERQRS